MSAPYSEILSQERARLLRAAADAFAPADGEAELAGLFAAADELQKAIYRSAQRRSNELDKDELICLQSLLQQAMQERLRAAIEECFAHSREALLQLAERDPLTQLPNRAAFERRLRNESVRAQRYGREFSLVLFDVDNFKSVNDRFGHQVGDQVLSDIARGLQLAMRQSDAVFRYGGDEFIALCPETSRAAADALLNRLEVNLRDQLVQFGLGAGTGMSWGTSSFPTDATDLHNLIQLADRRLYDCKKERRRLTAVRSQTTIP